MLDNQDPFVKIANDETGEAVYFNDDDESTNSNRNSAIPNFTSRLIADNEILDSLNSLNLKQRDTFNIVHN